MPSGTLSDVVYQHLWPDGKIPVKVARNLAAIDGRIAEIQRLAEGRLPLGMDRRIIDPTMSAEITEQIIQLRGSTNPPMRWRDIAFKIGHNQTSDSVRARYIAAQERAMKQEGYAALSGEVMKEGQLLTELIKTEPASQEFRPHEHDELSGDSGQLAPGPVRTSPGPEKLPVGIPENCQLAHVHGNINCRDCAERQEIDATLRNVAEPGNLSESPSSSGATKKPFGSYPLNFEEAPVPPKEPEPGRNKYGRYDANVPPEVDEIIESMWKGGHGMKEISAALAKEGYEMDYLRVRGRISSVIAKKNKHSERREDKSADSMKKSSPHLITQTAPASTKTPIIPNNCTRQELDAVMWGLWKHQGKTPDEISDLLCNAGYIYGEQTVRRRLEQQDAKL